VSFRIGSVVNTNALEHAKWKEFQQYSKNKLTRTEEEAPEVLAQGQRICLDSSTSDLDHGHLDQECDGSDSKEEPVTANARDDVNFAILEFSCIDLIEYLHEHEDLEHIGEMNQLWSVVTNRLVPWECWPSLILPQLTRSLCRLVLFLGCLIDVAGTLVVCDPLICCFDCFVGPSSFEVGLELRVGVGAGVARVLQTSFRKNLVERLFVVLFVSPVLTVELSKCL